jgi:hypothetical protein
VTSSGDSEPSQPGGRPEPRRLALDHRDHPVAAKVVLAIAARDQRACPREHLLVAIVIDRVRESSAREVELPVRLRTPRAPDLLVREPTDPVVRAGEIAEPHLRFAQRIRAEDAGRAAVARAVDAIEREPRSIAQREGVSAAGLARHETVRERAVESGGVDRRRREAEVVLGRIRVLLEEPLETRIRRSAGGFPVSESAAEESAAKESARPGRAGGDQREKRA